jgi:hypothetical protein
MHRQMVTRVPTLANAYPPPPHTTHQPVPRGSVAGICTEKCAPELRTNTRLRGSRMKSGRPPRRPWGLITPTEPPGTTQPTPHWRYPPPREQARRASVAHGTMSHLSATTQLRPRRQRHKPTIEQQPLPGGTTHHQGSKRCELPRAHTRSPPTLERPGVRHPTAKTLHPPHTNKGG